MSSLRILVLLAVLPLFAGSSPDWVEGIGGKVDRDPAGDVIGLRLRGTWVTDTELLDVARLPKLERLDLSHTRITDEGLLHLKSARQIRDLSIRIYEEGRAYAAERGIIVADTKFEFGLLDGRIILIDECLTPDSSRFWPADQYALGMSPPSFDKQFVRDYLETLEWDKTPPAPPLPEEVIRKTSEKYLEAYAKLTGSAL